jgi:hypothetical protein
MEDFHVAFPQKKQRAENGDPRAGWNCRITRRLLFVRSADEGHVFFRILVEIHFAFLAAEFHFLVLVNKDEWLAHFTELLAGDWTGGEHVWLGLGVGYR